MAKIYLSSTYSDLIEHRKAIYKVLRSMHHDVVAMEHYVATDERPLDKCLKDVAACDIYIGVFAWRYGFVPSTGNPSQKSITELEYCKARELDKPCLIFLLAEDAPWPPTHCDWKTGDGEKGKHIEALRARMAKGRIINHFHSADQLASFVGAAVANCLKKVAQDATDGSSLLRLSYLESVYEHYKSVKLPIGPADGISLEAIFQPLTLRRDPLAIEELEREKRRKFLGESLPDEERASRFGDLVGQTSQVVMAENGEDALKKSPQRRVVILGGPGTGKTTTLKHLIACCAKEALDDPGNLDAPLPIFISLTDLANSNKGLQSYLTQVVDYLKVDSAFAQKLWQAVEKGKAFFCLDSLDEVTPAIRGDMIELINTWASGMQNTWIIGSRFTEYKNGQFKRGQFSEWELQPMSSSVRHELAQRLIPLLQKQLPAVHEGTLTPASFVHLLEKHPQAVAWGDNPLLFSLAAIVFVKTGALPSSRVALYRDVIEAILKMREQDPMQYELLLRIFAKLALWLYQTKGRTFTRGNLITFLEDVQKRSWEETARIANRIVASGLMEVVARETYGFRHQTFQEYLTAVELAFQLTSLDSSIREDAWQFAWSKRTYSRWTEILRLLFGILAQQHGLKGKQQAQRWLRALAEQRNTVEGDPGDLGLLLALKSLSELTEPLDGINGRSVQEEKIVLLWVEELFTALKSQRYARRWRLENLAYEVSHLHEQILNVVQQKLLTSLVDSNANMRINAIYVLGVLGEGVSLDTLIDMLQDVNGGVRGAVVEALGKQGERVPVEVLQGALQDENREVRSAAVEALGEQAERVPVEVLQGALQDENEYVRRAAVRALAERVPVEVLQGALQDESAYVRSAAVRALGEQGERVPVKILQGALKDNEWLVRSTAVRALGEQGDRVSVKVLQRALKDENKEVRRAAVWALGEQGERVPVEVLQGALQDENKEVRRAVLRSLNKKIDQNLVYGFVNSMLDENVQTSIAAVQVLGVQKREVPVEALQGALHDENKYVRRAAVEVLGTQGEKVPIEILQGVLQDIEWLVRSAAVRALGEQGERVSVEVLQGALQDDHEEVRRAAMRALGKQGERVPVEVLQGALQDENREVRRAAVWALGEQGERVPVEILQGALQDNEWLVRNAAVWALGEQGERVPVEVLQGALQDENQYVRGAAVEALGERGEGVPMEVLQAALQDAHEYVRSAAVEALGKRGERVSVEVFIKTLYDWHEDVRAAAAEVSGRQKRIPLDLLLATLADESDAVRQNMLEALMKTDPDALSEVNAEALAILRGESAGAILGSVQQYFVIDIIGDMDKVPPVLMDRLISLLDWPYWLVRVRAVEALGRIRRNIPDVAILRLLEMRRDPDPNMYVLREAADDALAEILSLEAGIEDDE